MSTISLIMSVYFANQYLFLAHCLGSTQWTHPVHPWALLASASAAVLATASVLAGPAFWAADIKNAEDVNSWRFKTCPSSSGVEVPPGCGLYRAWIASSFLTAGAITHD